MPAYIFLGRNFENKPLRAIQSQRRDPQIRIQRDVEIKA